MLCEQSQMISVDFKAEGAVIAGVVCSSTFLNVVTGVDGVLCWGSCLPVISSILPDKISAISVMCWLLFYLTGSKRQQLEQKCRQ